jgi:hypothetical protein
LVSWGLALANAEAARPRPPAVVSATTGEDTITITGADFGDEVPRVTLGLTELAVLTHGPTEIVAGLPERVPPGSYQLLVHRGRGSGALDREAPGVFVVTIGATGPVGPQGIKGEKGDPAAAALPSELGDGALQPRETADGAVMTSLLRPLRRAAAGCYRHWGDTTCLSGYDATLTGRPGGIESYTSGAGTLYGNVECVSGSASPIASFGASYTTRLMRSDAEGDGMQAVDNSCAICCRGGCYTALGTDTCAAGYSAAYTGRVGGVEAFGTQQIQGQTLCIDSNAPASFTWASGYTTRLMRHRTPLSTGGPNGVDVIGGVCAVCCKP